MMADHPIFLRGCLASYDQWALLKQDATKHGPACVALVERVGEELAQRLLREMDERFQDGSAVDYYKLTGAETGFYEILEGELVKVEPSLLFAAPTDPRRFGLNSGLNASDNNVDGFDLIVVDLKVSYQQFAPPNYSLVLLEVGENRVAVMKTIRTLWPQITLKQAQAYVAAVPIEICPDVRHRDADQIRKLFHMAGARIELKSNNYD